MFYNAEVCDTEIKWNDVTSTMYLPHLYISMLRLVKELNICFEEIQY